MRIRRLFLLVVLWQVLFHLPCRDGLDYGIMGLQCQTLLDMFHKHSTDYSH